jgi:purine-nucleoside phosphorylase
VETILSDLEGAVAKWRTKGWPEIEALVVSGSGLAVDLHSPIGMEGPLADFLPFDAQGIDGHPLHLQILEPSPGRFICYQRGRLHSYQGFDAHQTVFPIRLAALMGAKRLIMSNAAGGLRDRQSPGDLVLISDHINLIGLNPLRGQLPPAWGPQFPDMVFAYDPELRQLAHAIGQEDDISLQEGVYAGVAGPSYETPAEVRMLRTMGADLVGMSTVLEVIAANHIGMSCLCFSLVTNLGAGVSGEALDHSEVMAAGKQAEPKIQHLIGRLIESEELFASGHSE